MIYLLDVNALTALGLRQHVFHDRVSAWCGTVGPNAPEGLATCSIAELAFVRILTQAPQYGFSLAQARDLLARLRSSAKPSFSFISDDQDLSRLPAWVKTSRQTTDGHLLQLARSHGYTLATLDRRVPNSFLIP